MYNLKTETKDLIGLFNYAVKYDDVWAVNLKEEHGQKLKNNKKYLSRTANLFLSGKMTIPELVEKVRVRAEYKARMDRQNNLKMGSINYW